MVGRYGMWTRIGGNRGKDIGGVVVVQSTECWEVRTSLLKGCKQANPEISERPGNWEG